MVRTLVISVLSGSAIASESGVLMQSQSNSDGALAMLGMNDQFVGVMQSGSGRVQKMQQNTEAMEDQYKALIQDIITSHSMDDPKTGTPWLPADSFLKTVETQFKALRDELKSEKVDNQKILDDAIDAIKQCNTDRGTDFSNATGVLTAQKTMNSSRNAHSTCRGLEDGEIADMETKCKAFDDLAAKCDDNQDWYAQYNNANISADADNTLQDVVTKATSCKVAVDDATDKAEDCDDKQDTFKTNACAYATHLEKVCKKHDDCYELQVENWNTTTKSVKTLQDEQQTIWRMIGKVTCYLDVLLAASFDNMPTQDNITTCSSKTIDDSELIITYTPKDDKDACRAHGDLNGDLAGKTHRPGVGDWYKEEMEDTGLNLHGKLNANTACAR